MNTVKTTTIQKPAQVTTTTNTNTIKRSSSINNNNNNNYNNTQKMANSKSNTLNKNHGIEKLDLKQPTLSRANSVSSIASSVASSMSSSTSSKLSAVQKFRQMVLDNRD